MGAMIKVAAVSESQWHGMSVNAGHMAMAETKAWNGQYRRPKSVPANSARNAYARIWGIRRDGR